MRLFRLLKIIGVSIRYGLDEFFLGHERVRGLRAVINVLFFWRVLAEPRAVRLRRALEALGPIFVKFGQVLSTRRDLLPTDIADELAKLQDRVPPFPAEQAVAMLERVYGRPVAAVFAEFDRVAHRQRLGGAGAHRPAARRDGGGGQGAAAGNRPVIANDLALLHAGATLIELLWADGKRLRPHEVVAEFAKHLEVELDLLREASNASQLRRNFEGSPLLLVPEIYWDYCSNDVMVMQRMHGTPVSAVAELRAQGVDIPRLARAGVEIFFTQVFRHGFFHADMHPGNILVTRDGRYVALDFGIMGTLDRHSTRTTWRRTSSRSSGATTGGWRRCTSSPAGRRAIRASTISSPRSARCASRSSPSRLKEISFGRVLLRLFQTSRRFNIQVQPQLVLLQKTLLNIEGLGRELDPDLDLWQTAKPYLERWMSEQVGWRGFVAAREAGSAILEHDAAPAAAAAASGAQRVLQQPNRPANSARCCARRGAGIASSS